MSFADTQREVEAAAACLTRAAVDAAGWADQQRLDFDKQRLAPLAGAATKLITALRKAQEAQRKAERLLAR